MQRRTHIDSAGRERPDGRANLTGTGYKVAALTQPVNDGTVDIIVGHRPVSDWDGLERDYFAAGGEQIRSEFMKVIQTSG